MPTADRAEIARLLREIGALLQIKGENPFKTRAYDTAASRLESLSDELFASLADGGRLVELPGIGDAIADKIATLRATGRLPYHEKLRAEFPPGLVELTGLPELGPRRIATLRAALGVASLEDLAAACREGRVRSVRGFSEALEKRLSEAVAERRRVGEQRPLASLMPLAAELRGRIGAALPGVRRVEIAGGLRRFAEMVEGIQLVVEAPDPGAAIASAVRLPQVERAGPLGAAGGDGSSEAVGLVLRDGTRVQLTAAAEPGFAGAWLRATGGAAHLRRLEALARERGGGSSLAAIAAECRSEADLYAALGLPFIAPELREDAGEIEAALEGRLPALVEAGEVQGITHAHTRSSDGKDELADMARAARALGMRYLTVTDHSRSAAYAGGLSIERLEAQADAIAAAQEQVPEVALLRGAEVDILEDGRLDFPDRVLARLDVVIASIHSRFKQDAAQMTRRLLAALDNPWLDILAHPTGRLLGRRPAYAADMDAVLEKAAARGVAVEVNGNPARLDLSGALVRRARSFGARIVVSADAHSCAELAHVFNGVSTARRGWAGRDDVLNTLPLERFREAIRARRT